MVTFPAGSDMGKLKVIKTRDCYIIEAHVSFDIEREIQCDEDYNFPEDQLLINADRVHLKNLKGIYTEKVKQEILDLKFFRESLVFKGDVNQKYDSVRESEGNSPKKRSFQSGVLRSDKGGKISEFW